MPDRATPCPHGPPCPDDRLCACSNVVKRRDDEAVIAEALQQKREDILLLTRGMPDETVARYLTKVDAQIAALASVSLRLQNAETARDDARQAMLAARVPLGRIGSSEPLTARDYRRLAVEAHNILRAALASSAEREERHA